MYIHVYTCIHMYTHVYTCIYTYMHVYTCIHMYRHVHTCIYMSTRIFGVDKRPQHVILEPINVLNTHFWCPGAGPRRSQVPQGSPQAAPKAPQETQRHFATKTSKLAEAFDEFWRGGPQNSNASSVFFLRISIFPKNIADFAWPQSRRQPCTTYQPLSSARTP